MNHFLKSLTVPLVVAAGFIVPAMSSHAQNASATISGVQDGANWDYTVTLNNTDTLNLNGFWYGWIQFVNDLPTAPSSPGNSLGWNNLLDGNSIQYHNTSGTPLTPGNSATFTFVDASSPTQITAGISGESVAYTGIIDASQSSPGDSTGIITPVLISAPEPSTLGLLATGLVAAAFKFRNITGLRRQ